MWCRPGPRFARNRPTGVSAPSGRQELDPPGAGTQRDGVDTLLLEAVAMLDLRLEQPRIRLDGCVEIGDRDPDVVRR